MSRPVLPHYQRRSNLKRNAHRQSGLVSRLRVIITTGALVEWGTSGKSELLKPQLDFKLVLILLDLQSEILLASKSSLDQPTQS